MIRNVDINDISDGKKYYSGDLARLGCHECSGCSSCCRGVSDTIVLDPYDIFQLTCKMKKSFEELMKGYIRLLLIDGVIMPVLAINPDTDQCNFLDEKGRCSIHAYRPGICRLFPLGRLYEDGNFYYFLQKDECKKTNRYDVRIDKWIGIKPISSYENFVNDWHYAIKELGEELLDNPDPEMVRKIQMTLLQLFYIKPYSEDRDFYEQYKERMSLIR